MDQPNRSAAATSSAGGGAAFTGFGPGASAAPYASGGNFNTQQATNDFAARKITAAQRDQVYSAASQATDTQGAGISPSTQAEMRGTAGVGQQLQASQDAQQAADAAYQRQNPGPPSAAQGGYGMLPGGGVPTTVAANDGSTLIYNGKVVAPGTSVTPVNFGKTVFGNPNGSAQVGNSQPGAPSAADADYKAQEAAALKAYPAIGVAGSPENRSFVQAFNTGGADKSNVLGLAHSLFAPKDQSASIASPAPSTVASATPAGASPGASTPGQDWFNSLLQRNQPASPLAPASTAASSSTAANTSGYPDRPAPSTQPYTVEQQFKDLQAGGTGTPPATPAYTAPKVYDKNDPSSQPDATTNVQMAFIRNIADPATGNPVSPFDKSPVPPNSLLASAAPGAITSLGGPATSQGTGTFDTANAFANGQNPFNAANTPPTTAATTPAGKISLDTTNPLASPLKMDLSGTATNSKSMFGVNTPGFGGSTPIAASAPGYGTGTSTANDALNKAPTAAQALASAPGYGPSPGTDSATPASPGKSMFGVDTPGFGGSAPTASPSPSNASQTNYDPSGAAIANGGAQPGPSAAQQVAKQAAQTDQDAAAAAATIGAGINEDDERIKRQAAAAAAASKQNAGFA